MDMVVYICSDFLIAVKPHGIPTVPLRDPGEDCLLSRLSADYPELLSVRGQKAVEGGAVHRLDTATGGLVLFARTQAFMDHILEAQSRGLFVKAYEAVCDDVQADGSFRVVERDGYVESYFRAFGPGGKQVRPVVDVKRSDNKKLYKTYIEKLGNKYKCTIENGFRHQIRTHLAAIGHPIKGDRLYNPSSDEPVMSLFCHGVCFPLPDGKEFSFSLER